MERIESHAQRRQVLYLLRVSLLTLRRCDRRLDEHLPYAQEAGRPHFLHGVGLRAEAAQSVAAMERRVRSRSALVELAGNIMRMGVLADTEDFDAIDDTLTR